MNHSNQELAETTHGITDNEEILRIRTALREESFARGPQIGDFIIMPDEERPRRVAHDWGNYQRLDGIQPTCKNSSGSFYLADGYASHSGSLDPSVPAEDLVDTGETRPGRFWFFSRNYHRADNGISVEAPCKVYSYEPGSGTRGHREPGVWEDI